MIAEAKIKTDKIDARLLADLVRADLVARSYIPPKKVRMQRTLLRERISLVESRTMIKNRIHSLLDKYDLQPTYTDMFGKRGREWLRSLNLPSIDQTILEVNLQRLEELEAHIDAFTSKIAQEAVGRPDVKLLMGFTGIDYYSAMLLASEIGDVKRFPSAKKLVRYAGLAPGTRQSAEKTIHGHIVKEGKRRTCETRVRVLGEGPRTPAPIRNGLSDVNLNMGVKLLLRFTQTFPFIISSSFFSGPGGAKRKNA